MKYTFLLILLLISSSVFAQIQGQKGNLILRNGETLNGNISHFYDKPSEIIIYLESGKKEVYGPGDVQEIRLFNGERFTIKNYNESQGSRLLVLQTLIESSKISLYAREDNADLYYYVSKDSALYRLENNIIVSSEAGKTFKRKDNKYISTLSALMADRFDLISSLNHISLKDSDISKIILDYNAGDVTYFWKFGTETIREPNWAVFVQYSQYASFQGAPTTSFSSGQMIGFQYYFSKSSRHSIKLSLERARYMMEYEDLEATGLGIRYEYAFKKAEKYGIYLLLQVGEMAHVEELDERDLRGRIVFLPRFSPGLGLEVRPLPRISIYSEVNHLLMMEKIPGSFSLGVKYDFGNTTW